MRYLVDTSALVRIQRRQAEAAWDDLARHGLIAMCEPVLVEALSITESKRYSAAEAELQEIYPWVPVVDNVWELVAAVRRELAQHSAHQGMSVADLVVAATAIKLKLTVLHEDGDFETIARFVPQLTEQRVSAGPA